MAETKTSREPIEDARNPNINEPEMHRRLTGGHSSTKNADELVVIVANFDRVINLRLK